MTLCLQSIGPIPWKYYGPTTLIPFRLKSDHRIVSPGSSRDYSVVAMGTVVYFPLHVGFAAHGAPRSNLVGDDHDNWKRAWLKRATPEQVRAVALDEMRWWSRLNCVESNLSDYAAILNPESEDAATLSYEGGALFGDQIEVLLSDQEIYDEAVCVFDAAKQYDIPTAEDRR